MPRCSKWRGNGRIIELRRKLQFTLVSKQKLLVIVAKAK